MVTTTGSVNDVAGVPKDGGGVVLNNFGNGAVDWTVTNHGTFQTTNDAIFMANLGGTGTHVINNDGYLGTAGTRLGGSGAVIVAPQAGSNGTVNNDDR